MHPIEQVNKNIRDYHAAYEQGQKDAAEQLRNSNPFPIDSVFALAYDAGYNVEASNGKQRLGKIET